MMRGAEREEEAFAAAQAPRAMTPSAIAAPLAMR